MHGRARISVWLAAALALAAGGARGAGQDTPGGWTLLAVSTAHKVRVLALGAPQWCGPTLTLRLAYDPASPDLADPGSPAALLDRLKPTIVRSCPAAVGAHATVDGMPGGATTLAADAATGWVFAAATARAPVPVAAPAPAPASITIPSETGYASALLADLAANPGLRADGQVLRWWAAQHFAADVARTRNDEFAQAAVLETARADLARAIAAAPPGEVAVTLGVSFGAYDFAASRFPIAVGGDRITMSRPCCTGAPPLPGAFVLRTDDLALIDGLAMPTADAQAFLQSRVHGGGTDRRLLLLLRFALVPPGFDASNAWAPPATARLVDVLFLNPTGRMPDAADIVAHWPRSLIDARRDERARLAAEQAAQARRQALQAARGPAIAMLQAAPLATRLANAISPAAIDAGLTLDNARSARARAAMGGAPVQVAMLVQADAGGARDTAARWPGRLALEAPATSPEWIAGRWYVVRGTLTLASLASDADTPAEARLAATTILPCEAATCTDRADPERIVDARLANP